MYIAGLPYINFRIEAKSPINFSCDSKTRWKKKSFEKFIVHILVLSKTRSFGNVSKIFAATEKGV